MKRIVAVANQKGGVGKTTTAVNLATGLVLAGRSAVLIDLDPQANATSGIGVELAAEGEIHPLLMPPANDWVLRSTRYPGLCVLPSSPELVKLEHELSRHADGSERLARYLHARDHTQDFVIIDCPPSLGVLTANALNAATGVLIPIQCEYYAMEGLSRILDAISTVRRASNRSLRLEGIMLTMFDPDLDLCHEVVNEVRGYFADDVYGTIIPRDVALSEAASFGQSVFQYAPRAPAALAYLALTKEVIANG